MRLTISIQRMLSPCLYLVALLFLLDSATAAEPSPLLVAEKSDGTATTASFTLGMRLSGEDSFTASASASDNIVISGSITPDLADIGANADIYIVIATGGGFYMRNTAGGFDSWNGAAESLAPYLTSMPLTNAMPVDIFEGTLGISATLDIYLAYRVSSGAALVYTPVPAHLVITSATVIESTFYTPAPLIEALQLSRSTTWQELGIQPENLLRFEMGTATSFDVIAVNDTNGVISANLEILTGLANQSNIADDELLRSIFQFIAEAEGGFRIISTKHSNYALDWESTSGALQLRDIRSGSRDDSSAAYLVFELASASEKNLVAIGRKGFDASAQSFVTESDWSARQLKIADNDMHLIEGTGSDLTLYSAIIDLSIPFDFNPQGTDRVSNPEVTPLVVHGNDPITSTPQQVNSQYASQLAAPGAEASTRSAAAAMLDMISSSLAAEGTQIRYPAEFYLAFRDGLFARVLTSSASTDGVIGQLTVPYVYFTNASDESGTHHPFMVIASYGIPDGTALLWDVARPPGDGDAPTYEEQSVTRSYHREAFLMKIPLRDYGEVSSLTENTMVSDLASDVGVTTFDHHNYASVSATGVAIDGVVIYPSYNNSLHVSQQAAELSARGMHSGRGLGVHYHADAHSATGAGLNLYNGADYTGRDHPPIVSIGFDGVAGYGIYRSTDTSSEGVNIELDEFGGHEHGIYAYHYHSHTQAEVVEVQGPGGSGTEYTAHMLPPQGAWSGRINDIPEFWQGPSPNYVGGKSAYLGTE